MPPSHLWRRAWQAMVWTHTTPCEVPLPPTTTMMSRRCGRCCRSVRAPARLCRGAARRCHRPTPATSLIGSTLRAARATTTTTTTSTPAVGARGVPLRMSCPMSAW
eukprot:5041199-Prymnesium_polylepis.1